MRIALERVTARTGDHASIYCENDRHGPHIRPSKPFTKDQEAWATITYHNDAPVHRSLFRQRTHATQWLVVLSRVAAKHQPTARPLLPNG